MSDELGDRIAADLLAFAGDPSGMTADEIAARTAEMKDACERATADLVRMIEADGPIPRLGAAAAEYYSRRLTGKPTSSVERRLQDAARKIGEVAGTWSGLLNIPEVLALAAGQSEDAAGGAITRLIDAAIEWCADGDDEALGDAVFMAIDSYQSEKE